MIRSADELRRLERANRPRGERLIQQGGAAAIPAGAKGFRVHAVAGDYLTCKPLTFEDGVEVEPEGEADVHVAKPWLLQSSSFSGKTYELTQGTFSWSGYSADGQTRTMTDENPPATEYQVVIPRYEPATNDETYPYPGDLIFAVRATTGVSFGFAAVGWQDANVDGRAWAKINDS
jgi:hypothetical protein